MKKSHVSLFTLTLMLAACNSGSSSNTPSPRPPGPSQTATAYLANYSGNNLHKCQVDPQNGQLSDCQRSAGQELFHNPSGVARSGNYLYIANNAADDSSNIASSYVECEISGSNLADCSLVNLENDGVLNSPVGISFNAGYAYIANYANASYTKCKTQVDGKIDKDTCQTKELSGMPEHGTPEVIVFNNATAYITDQHNDGYLRCHVDGEDGSLVNCLFSKLSKHPSQIRSVGPRGLLFADGYAYFANSAFHGEKPVRGAVSSYTKCAVENDGSLDLCTTLVPANGKLNSPTAMVKSGEFIYITNEQGPGYNYTICGVNHADGSLTNCVNQQTQIEDSKKLPGYTYLVFVNESQ